jgi:hypothetical protein
MLALKILKEKTRFKEELGTSKAKNEYRLLIMTTDVNSWY